MVVKCFFLEPTGQDRRYLRRYHDSSDQKCIGRYSYHNGEIVLDVIDSKEETNDQEVIALHKSEFPYECECGYKFVEQDHWQIFSDRLYKQTDNGIITSLRLASPGALWFAPWLDDVYVPQLEHVLCCKVPGGHDWVIDSEASNCTMPLKSIDEKGTKRLPYQTDHHCWIIHGTPPNITVDKNGVTCGAGAGSIAFADFHGFLTNGELRNA